MPFFNFDFCLIFVKLQENQFQTSYAREQYEAAQREEIELELENDGYFQGVTARQKTASSRFTSSGTTATVVLIEDGYLVYYCWVGDSRAILCRNGVAKRLTFEHSLEAENPLLGKGSAFLCLFARVFD